MKVKTGIPMLGSVRLPLPATYWTLSLGKRLGWHPDGEAEFKISVHLYGTDRVPDDGALSAWLDRQLQEPTTAEELLAALVSGWRVGATVECSWNDRHVYVCGKPDWTDYNLSD